nr:exo-alpha-sialidase [Clostridia bacterium]
MKKIGREVLFLGTGEGNPRNGEGTFIRLKNGQIMFAYTEYYGSDWADHAIAHLCACTSGDEGESWSEPRVIVEKDEKAENIMSPSLIRLNNGDLGIIFLRKEKMPDNGVTCMPAIARSTDEGMTFSEPKVCDIPLGYYCAINDGA